jgi:hypothetical protein
MSDMLYLIAILILYHNETVARKARTNIANCIVRAVGHERERGIRIGTVTPTARYSTGSAASTSCTSIRHTTAKGKATAAENRYAIAIRRKLSRSSTNSCR